jgi:hypothetical protein
LSTDRAIKPLGELDESNASLRLLITLQKFERPMMLSVVYHEMMAIYSLGRRKVDTALTTCIELGLVKRETKRMGRNPMPSLFHSLTPKGKKIATIINQLERAF